MADELPGCRWNLSTAAGPGISTSPPRRTLLPRDVACQRLPNEPRGVNVYLVAEGKGLHYLVAASSPRTVRIALCRAGVAAATMLWPWVMDRIGASGLPKRSEITPPASATMRNAAM